MTPIDLPEGAVLDVGRPCCWARTSSTSWSTTRRPSSSRPSTCGCTSWSASRSRSSTSARGARTPAAIPDSLLVEQGEHLTPAQVGDLAPVVGKYLAMGRYMQVLGLDRACAVDPARVAALS